MTSQRRVRLAPEVRLARLTEEATTLISQRGYKGFSISALAERAGVTRAGVQHYFASKEEVLIAVLAARDDRAGTDFTIADGAEVRGRLDDVVASIPTEPEMARLYSVLSMEALDQQHPAHDYFAARWRRSVATLSAHLQGHGRSSDELAVEVLAFIDGLQTSWLRDATIDVLAHWRAFADVHLQPALDTAHPTD